MREKYQVTSDLKDNKLIPISNLRFTLQNSISELKIRIYNTNGISNKINYSISTEQAVFLIKIIAY